MPLTPREMIKHLKHNGFEVISQNGSHVKMGNPETNLQTIVPYHSKPLKKRIGTGNLKTGGAKISSAPLNKYRRYLYEQTFLSGCLP